jgi:hypothetical protein
MIAPQNTTIPVILVEIGEITAADPNISEFVTRDKGSPWYHFRWLWEMRWPLMDDDTVHVN